MKVILYGIKISNDIRELVIETILILQARKVIVGIYETFFYNLNLNKDSFQDLNISYLEQDDIDSSNLLVTFGGDGTILSALPLLKSYPIPIVGVNTGRLGFLTSVSKEKFLDYLDDYLNNKYVVSKRNLLKIITNLPIEIPYALNEIAITRKETSSMITIESNIDNEYLNTFRGDGLIISTPTGSTAYNLSCGGPILSPDNQAIILAPIAGHNLNIRPLVIPNSVCLKFKVSSRSNEFFLSLDSRLYSISNDTEFEIEIAPFFVQLLFPKDYSYYKTLRNKLYWGKDLRN